MDVSKELFDFEEEEDSKLTVTPHDIRTTISTSHIVMTSDEIMVFVNEVGRATPILIVAQCKLDGIEYAALYDTKTEKRYIVELIRHNGIIKEFRDLDSERSDEEWGVLTTYFLEQKVYDKHKIDNWIRNTSLRSQLTLGKHRVPGLMLKRIEEKNKRRNVEK
jgi:hypothetical protein